MRSMKKTHAYAYTMFFSTDTIPKKKKSDLLPIHLYNTR